MQEAVFFVEKEKYSTRAITLLLCKSITEILLLIVKDQKMAEKKRDYYEVLGIARSATRNEVRKAFLRLARRHHPDVSAGEGGGPDFIEINEAYEVLINPRKRAVYDRYGHAGLSDARGLQLRRIKSFQIINDLFSDFLVDDIEKERLN